MKILLAISVSFYCDRYESESILALIVKKVCMKRNYFKNRLLNWNYPDAVR